MSACAADVTNKIGYHLYLMATRIGTAGWTIPRDSKDAFPAEGSHLGRYSQALSGVEINSSFHRPHQAKTYRRWNEETPDAFRFSVKLAKDFTHVQRLATKGAELAAWLAPVHELDAKLGAILVQLPPSLAFDRKLADRFFKNLRKHCDRLIALEPRHCSWSSEDALQILLAHDITKVEADPEKCAAPPDRSRPRYIRLHGSPVIYKSEYEMATIEFWSDELRKSKGEDWVIFDNTTFGFATKNALALQALL